jgi:hypothetical protein
MNETVQNAVDLNLEKEIAAAKPEIGDLDRLAKKVFTTLASWRSQACLAAIGLSSGEIPNT